MKNLCIYSLPRNEIGRAIVMRLTQNPSVHILKLSARPNALLITVVDGHHIVERVLARFGIK